ncbi:carbohydrate ABC transporter permease, partial [Sinorhizobium sp. 6-117]
MIVGSHAITTETLAGAKLRRRKSLVDVSCDAVLALLLLVFVAPIAWMIVLSFQSDRAIISMFWELDLTLANIAGILAEDQPFRAQLVNSIAIVAGTVALCGTASTLAAYGLSKLKLPWWLNASVGASCAVVPLLPPMALVPGFYVTLIQTGLLGSLTGLIILNTILNLPFATVLMKIGFDEVPPALQEAASI